MGGGALTKPRDSYDGVEEADTVLSKKGKKQQPSALRSLRTALSSLLPGRRRSSRGGQAPPPAAAAPAPSGSALSGHPRSPPNSSAQQPDLHQAISLPPNALLEPAHAPAYPSGPSRPPPVAGGASTPIPPVPSGRSGYRAEAESLAPGWAADKPAAALEDPTRGYEAPDVLAALMDSVYSGGREAAAAAGQDRGLSELGFLQESHAQLPTPTELHEASGSAPAAAGASGRSPAGDWLINSLRGLFSSGGSRGERAAKDTEPGSEAEAALGGRDPLLSLHALSMAQTRAGPGSPGGQRGLGSPAGSHAPRRAATGLSASGSASCCSLPRAVPPPTGSAAPELSSASAFAVASAAGAAAAAAGGGGGGAGGGSGLQPGGHSSAGGTGSSAGGGGRRVLRHMISRGQVAPHLSDHPPGLHPVNASSSPHLSVHPLSNATSGSAPWTGTTASGSPACTPGAAAAAATAGLTNLGSAAAAAATTASTSGALGLAPATAPVPVPAFATMSTPGEARLPMVLKLPYAPDGWSGAAGGYASTVAGMAGQPSMSGGQRSVSGVSTGLQVGLSGQHSGVSGQQSGMSGQQSGVSGQRSVSGARRWLPLGLLGGSRSRQMLAGSESSPWHRASAGYPQGFPLATGDEDPSCSPGGGGEADGGGGSFGGVLPPQHAVLTSMKKRNVRRSFTFTSGACDPPGPAWASPGPGGPIPTRMGLPVPAARLSGVATATAACYGEGGGGGSNGAGASRDNSPLGPFFSVHQNAVFIADGPPHKPRSPLGGGAAYDSLIADLERLSNHHGGGGYPLHGREAIALAAAGPSASGGSPGASHSQVPADASPVPAAEAWGPAAGSAAGSGPMQSQAHARSQAQAQAGMPSGGDAGSWAPGQRSTLQARSIERSQRIRASPFAAVLGLFGDTGSAGSSGRGAGATRAAERLRRTRTNANQGLSDGLSCPVEASPGWAAEPWVEPAVRRPVPSESGLSHGGQQAFVRHALAQPSNSLLGPLGLLAEQQSSMTSTEGPAASASDVSVRGWTEGAAPRPLIRSERSQQIRASPFATALDLLVAPVAGKESPAAARSNMASGFSRPSLNADRIFAPLRVDVPYARQAAASSTSVIHEAQAFQETYMNQEMQVTFEIREVREIREIQQEFSEVRYRAAAAVTAADGPEAEGSGLEPRPAGRRRLGPRRGPTSYSSPQLMLLAAAARGEHVGPRRPGAGLSNGATTGSSTAWDHSHQNQHLQQAGPGSRAAILEGEPRGQLSLAGGAGGSGLSMLQASAGRGPPGEAAGGVASLATSLQLSERLPFLLGDPGAAGTGGGPWQASGQAGPAGFEPCSADTADSTARVLEWQSKLVVPVMQPLHPGPPSGLALGVGGEQGALMRGRQSQTHAQLAPPRAPLRAESSGSSSGSDADGEAGTRSHRTAGGVPGGVRLGSTTTGGEKALLGAPLLPGGMPFADLGSGRRG
ncbi:hypothetical protein HYH03_013272 [Edaphochlamys debaryana]|uniref:Uncharacterized protein n=1 Tax=Edaphochlamys debaryana TaxID=47281 RepID=A0A836BT31_9CHLO|nr:hypothetical protein HYH03_013272 [Edaphochlamys debaryana]|eukprot:KAG2488126.1 hypothetical protein HYH03_013272 [Edaphochlamys debaryana]